MYRVKNIKNFEKLNFNELEIYIEKPLIYDGSEFLMVYEGKYTIKVAGNNASLLKS